MPDFSYIARKLDGERVSGTLSAASEREAISILSGRSLFPVQVSLDKPPQSIGFGGRVSGQLMATFYQQLAGLLRSGVPLLKSLAILREQSSNSKLKGVLEDIYRRVEDGEGIGDAMSRHPKVFSDVGINMARAGAEGGFLEDGLDRVAKFTEQQVDLQARTMGALMYPMILGTIGTIIVAVLIIFFVPQFGEMFDQLRDRGELPFFTDALLGFSDALRNYWYIILGVVLLFGSFIYVQLQTESGKRTRDLIKIKIPLFGSIFQSLAVARFCRVLGTLLKNGVPILRSLEISRRAAGNLVLSEAVEQASENITAGASLAAPLSKSGYFPRTVVEMIAVAEESNTLDTVLVDIAESLEVRTGRRPDLLVRMIEPVMLLFMAGIVLVVVIALLLPIIKMSSTLS